MECKRELRSFKIIRLAIMLLLLLAGGLLSSCNTTEPTKESNFPLEIGNPDAFMEGDYVIEGDKLLLLRDHGQEVFYPDITAEELDETFEFFRRDNTLPIEGIFVSSDTTLPLAVFYGGAPTLKISHNGGASWDTIAFPKASDFGRSITKRAVGFTSSQHGYAALGTDWSMGGGEHKMCYFTSDGGSSWTEKALPQTMSSKTLLDIIMLDNEKGIVALSGGMEHQFPLLYSTSDAGDTWVAIEFPYDSLPMEVQHLTHLDSLDAENGKLILTLGQGDSGEEKAVFAANDINGTWEYIETYSSTIHGIG